VALASTLAAALCLRQLDYVPIWDGRIYADCVVNAAIGPLSLASLGCAEHSSQAYIGLLALVQRLAAPSYALILVTNLALLVLTFAAFARLLRRLCPDAELAAERLVAVVAFAVQPGLIAAAIQPGLDFGVLVFFVCAVAAAIEQRPWAIALFGSLMLFSKETSLLLYGLLAALYALLFVGLAKDATAGKLSRLLRLWPLALPVLLFAAYLLHRSLQPDSTLLWGQETPGHLLELLLTFQLNAAFASIVVLMFALGFLWVPSLGALAKLLAFARAPRLSPVRSDRVFIASLLIGSAWALSRLVTFSNPRYYLPILPLLLLAGFFGLLTLRSKRGRLALLGGYALLALLSNDWTLDPVSRAIYGTFPAGDRELLAMTSLTGECCGYGRDQLVYNSQFTDLHRLLDEASLALGVDEGTVLMTHPLADFYLLGPIDRRSRRRTLDRTAAFSPLVVHDPAELQSPDRPRRILFLALPYVDNQPLLKLARRFYEVAPPSVFAAGGLSLPVFELTAKGMK
jgi:hypothetical protein